MNRDRLSFSSIAWPANYDEAVAKVLFSRGIACVDLAPSKYAAWNSPDLLTIMAERKKFWSGSGFRIQGFQSLLFGTAPMNIFDAHDRRALLEHFSKVFEVAEVTSAKNLVFGSPSSRIKGRLSNEEANEIAAEFFSQLANLIAGREILVLIEPNPEIYGCDFVTTTQAAFDLVALIGRPEIKVNFDLGTSLIQNEDIREIVSNYAHLIGYVHLSTRGLAGLSKEPNQKILEFLELQSSFELCVEQAESSDAIGSIQESLNWLGVK